MTIITHLGDGGAFWIVFCIVLLIFKKTRKAGCCVFAALAIMLIVNNLVLKNIFDRPRPYDLEAWKSWFVYPDFVSRLDCASFPSGHTSSSFAAAVGSISTKDKRIYIPAIILAFLISFSRIYVHVHYFSDVIAGMIVGIVSAVLGILIAYGIYNLIQKKKDVKKNA